jgi:hypothetical protein
MAMIISSVWVLIGVLQQFCGERGLSPVADRDVFPTNATWPHNKHVTGANAAVRVVIVVFDGVKLLDAAGPATKP